MDSTDTTEGGFLVFLCCFGFVFFLVGLNCPFKLRQMTGWVGRWVGGGGCRFPLMDRASFASLLIRRVSKLCLE